MLAFFYACNRQMCAFARFTAGGARRLQSLPVPSFRSTNLAPSVTSFGRVVSDFHGMKESSMSEQFTAAPAACSMIKVSSDQAGPTYHARCVRLAGCQDIALPILEGILELQEGK